MVQTQQVNQTKIKFKPLGDRVLVRRLEEEETLKGGILLPDTAKKKQEQVEVVAVGPGKTDKKGNHIQIPVKIGDVVIMEKYSGQEVTINDNDYVIVKTDGLIAIVEQ